MNQNDGGVGPMIAIIIILLVIIAGGLYFWLGEKANEYTPEEETNFSELEASLDTSELDDIDSELNQIDSEFETSIETQ